ncbi:MAG TPA: ABC transporter ATP-binding protein [Myxococcota bacterium]|nr:ABC transporter ATP-binding protein [Myxococcota bacterium]
MGAVVEVRGVHKGFGGRAVLDGVDLDVLPGEVLGLIGPNGGGKSTLLLAIAGLIRPDRGVVTLGGVPAHRVAIERSGTVGLITAVPGLYPLLSGWENLEFFGALYGLGAAATRARVGDLAEELGVRSLLDVRAAACSSGMQQKVSLLRALLMDPSVLLLDEPTSNLDPLAAHTIYRAARAIADRGRSVVWVTHDLAAAEQICDRVALVRGHVHATLRFDGPRAEPAPGRLIDVWRGALGDA